MSDLSAKASTYILQPCQTCGNMYPVIFNDMIRHYFQVRCDECKAHTDTFKSESAAVAAWNDGTIEVEW